MASALHSVSSYNSVVQSKKYIPSRDKVWFYGIECKYEVILDNVKGIGWKIIMDEKREASVNVYWIDIATIHERFKTILPWQVINHFPGMPNIARKNRMGQNLNKMLKIFPQEYSYYPRTWVLPSELNDFRSQFDANGNAIGNKIYIIKPDGGCQGRGIFLTRTWDLVPQSENVVAQLYIKKPLLIDGFKFDLRLYCVVTSVKPLRMYLFHDGLVRMCTEEYVKPSKSNLDNVCMHLTNYAVNKHNSNFQQPTAASSDDCQDEGHKRSLLWFMNWVKENRGENKAKWLWKRMGIVCVRTVMSIMPILSREYDQYFKSFSSVPLKSDANMSNCSNGNNFNKSSEESEEEDDAAGDDRDSKSENSNEDKTSRESNGNAAETSGNANNKSNNGPKYRGCRCFEILGFDIMIDNDLKPWLIEVNHLPSFGTDSPLDLDIKTRLMQQVISALPVLPDDEQAYIAYHKAESEKRLTQKLSAKQSQQTTSNSGNQRKQLPQLNKAIPSSTKQDTVVISCTNGGSDESILENDTSANVPLVAIGDPSETESDSNAQVQNSVEDDMFIFENGDVTPERLDEIKKVLAVIYSDYSPEKIGKIDRLLAKYIGREEEFLRFVNHKYNVQPPKLRVAVEVLNSNVAPPALNVAHTNRSGNANPTKRIISVAKPAAAVMNSNKGSSSGRVGSRSLSPTPNRNLGGRSNAAWKVISSEEDEILRKEVTALHTPNEDDEWMLNEMRYLTQFTRIYPEMPKTAPSTGNENDEKIGASAESNNSDNEEEVEERDDDENEKEDDCSIVGNRNLLPVKEKSKYIAASHAEILYQVFLLDRKQMMRLRCPLGNTNRSKVDLETSSLPLVNNVVKDSSSGKGIVQWRPPLKKSDASINNAITKVPTKNQLDAATRLSQGLSVTNVPSQYRSTRKNYMPNSNGGTQIVLDIENSQDDLANYHALESLGASIPGATSRATKLLEEGKLARMKIEANKSTPASVLRQQIFKFDNNEVNPLMLHSLSTSDDQSVNSGYHAPTNIGNAMNINNNYNMYTRLNVNKPLVAIHNQVSGLPQYGVAPPTINTAYHRGGFQKSKTSMKYVNGTELQQAHHDHMLRQLFPEWF